MSTPPPLPADPVFSTGVVQTEPVSYQMAPASDDELAKPMPEACVNCGSKDFSAKTRLPVCEPCRMGLVRRPFPFWVKLSTCVVFFMVVVSLALSRERVQEAFLLARGKKMRQQQRWEDAYQASQELIARHTDTESLLTYAETAANSGHYEDAARTLKTLGGRPALNDQVARADAVEQTLLRALPQVPTPQPSYTPYTPASPVGDFSKFQLAPLPIQIAP